MGRSNECMAGTVIRGKVRTAVLESHPKKVTEMPS